MAKFKTRRLPESPPRLVGRHPSDYAQELQEWLSKIWQQSTGGIPPGFNNIAALPIVAHAGTAGTESDGWAAADHEHDGRHNLLDGAIDQDTSAGSPTKGNLIAGTGATWTTVPVGVDGHLIVADSASSPGLKWETPVTVFDSVAADNSKNFIGVAGTLPAVPTGSFVFGAFDDITGAGATAAGQYARFSRLNAGYTGNQDSVAVGGLNLSAGTASDPFATARGNIGISGVAAAGTVGLNMGGWFQTQNGTVGGAAIGSFANVFSTIAGVSYAIGMVAAETATGATTRIGLLAGFVSSVAGFGTDSAAVVADNAATTFPIFYARDNGTRVFSIEDGGGLRIKAASLGSVTLDNANHVIRCDASGGAITLTLPVLAAANRGIWYRIKKIDASANTVTIAAGGADTIDGAATSVLATQYTSEDVIAPDSGTDWAIFGVSSAASSGADDEARAMAFMAA